MPATALSALTRLALASCLLVLGLVICIYAVMGVDLYQAESPDYFGTLTSAAFTVCAPCAPRPGSSFMLRAPRPVAWESSGAWDAGRAAHLPGRRGLTAHTRRGQMLQVATLDSW